MSVLRHVLGALVLLLCSTDTSFGHDLRSLPCPDPNDIYPCVCQVDEYYDMEMDCSLVTSEDELAQVFSANFPFLTFSKLTIYQNNYLKVLRKGDLGPASFQTIYIHSGVLEEVQEEALAQSYATAETIDLGSNRLSSFPFHELPSFSALNVLLVNVNRLSFLPPLESASLQTIGVNENLFTQIPVDTFKGLTNINFIQAGHNRLTFESGTFKDMPYLAYVYIPLILQNHVPEGLIELSEIMSGMVYLNWSNISSIAVGGIVGLGNGHLYLADNYLEKVPEEVFGPILAGGATLDLNGNPLTCGCDIAWIVTNPDYMALMEAGATCLDGELLADLDPAIYEHLCPPA